MTYNNILISVENGVVLVSINRPKALNALNKELMGELDHFFSKGIKEVKEAKGIIITGTGERAFVAGADITEFVGLSEQEGREISEFGQNVFFKIERQNLPVVAVVNGFALGGGCELAMSCHLRIAEENAKFGQPEVNLGLIPGYGGTQRLLQYIGKSKAVELLLTADVIGAEEAKTLGLVNYIVGKGEGIEKATGIIEKIAGKGPIAIAKTIESVNAFYANKLDGFEEEFLNFGKVIGSEDSQEGAAAFLEKRKANFKGK